MSIPPHRRLIKHQCPTGLLTKSIPPHRRLIKASSLSAFPLSLHPAAQAAYQWHAGRRREKSCASRRTGGLSNTTAPSVAAHAASRRTGGLSISLISKFSLVQKRALYRDTGVRTLSSFLDRLLLLDAPLSERSRSSISAPSQRLSRYERIDTNDLLRRQIVGHVAGNGAGHQGNAWCVRIAPKMENGKGTAKKRGSRSDGAASGNHDFAGSWARKSSLILLLAHSSFSTSIKESSEYAPSSPASLFSKTMK